MPDPVWVVGAGGLLGGGVAAEFRRRNHDVLTTSIPWSQPDAAKSALREGAAELAARAAGEPWIIAWCAGAGVTGSSQQDLDAELDVFSSALGSIVDTLCGSGRAGGKMFLASSAGGVYAGSPTPPFTEESPVQPLAPYGVAKLEAERLASDFANASGTSVLIGRVANLYGPGQNLAKPQGLISVLAKAHLTGQPASVYVSLDTLRDYLFIDDAARMVADGVERLAGPDVAAGSAIVKILATQRADTIGALIGACRMVFKQRPRIVLGASPYAKVQAHDLRMKSIVWPELDRRTFTPLVVGIDATVRDMAHRRNRDGRL